MLKTKKNDENHTEKNKLEKNIHTHLHTQIQTHLLDITRQSEEVYKDAQSISQRKMWKEYIECNTKWVRKKKCFSLPSSFGIEGEKIAHKHKINANTFIETITSIDELQFNLLCKTIRVNESKRKKKQASKHSVFRCEINSREKIICDSKTKCDTLTTHFNFNNWFWMRFS